MTVFRIEVWMDILQEGDYRVTSQEDEPAPHPPPHLPPPPPPPPPSDDKNVTYDQL